MDENTQYRSLISDLVKKQMVMLGPNVALGQARKVAGLKLSDDGSVVELQGHPQTALAEVAKIYMSLSGAIAQNTLDSILSKYPGIKKPG